MRLIQLPALAGSCLGAAGRAGALATGPLTPAALATGALVGGTLGAGAFAGARAAAGLGVEGFTAGGTGFLAAGALEAGLAGMGFLAGALDDIVKGLCRYRISVGVSRAWTGTLKTMGNELKHATFKTKESGLRSGVT